MKVLVACEFSGTVRDEFARVGNFAVSADLLPSERPGYHYRGDVRDILHDGWDLMIAHPPCTKLATIGAQWMRNHEAERLEALAFFFSLWYAPIPMKCIENPVGIVNWQYLRPTQYIQPWQFGEYFTKKTCLWLKNLPRLQPTKIIDHRKYDLPSYVQYTHKRGRSTTRGHERSRTFPGIAEAMAAQWATEEDISRGTLRPSRKIP